MHYESFQHVQYADGPSVASLPRVMLEDAIVANSIRLKHAEKQLSAKELREERIHKLVTVAMIAAGTLAMMLILYFANQPSHEPSAMPHDVAPQNAPETWHN